MTITRNLISSFNPSLREMSWGIMYWLLPSLHTDGSLTLSFDYNHYDRPKTTPNAEKSWKSTGYYICHWVAISDDEDKKFELKNWKLKNYFIHVVTTSDDFGSSNDGCEELCWNGSKKIREFE